MAVTTHVPPRADIPKEQTWNAESVFASLEDWQASYESTAQLLPPGTSGRLQWYSSSLLPANLLSRRNGKLGVLVAETAGGKLVARFVPLDGALEGRPAMIDLPGETIVIVEGRHKLAPGDEIGIANAGGN